MNWWWHAVRYRYATFDGRARRSEYWSFWGVQTLIGLGLGFVEAVSASLVLSVTSGLFHLATIIPYLAVATRRLHDTGRSGWWLVLWPVWLIVCFVALVWIDSVSEEYTSASIVVVVFIAVMGIVGFLSVIIFLLMPGQDGKNRYGPDPKDEAPPRLGNIQ